MLRLVLGCLAVALSVQAHEPISTRLTWTQEISRIVSKRCLGCHSKGGNAPMPLTTYAEARPWAKALKEEVLQRRMPPWGAVKGFGDFKNDNSLTQDEIMRVAEWVEGGAPEGDPVYLPALRASPDKSEALAGRRVRKVTTPVTLLGIRPLQSVNSAQLTASLPDGSTVPLLWLREYREEWKRTFVYRDPVDLPRGTKLNLDSNIPFEFIVAPLRTAQAR